MKILTTPHMDRCIGCHSCSLACARLVHKRFSWETSGIRIQSSGGLSSGFVAKRCLACNPPPCAAVCPTGCLKARAGGGVTVRRKLCVDYCPHDCLEMGTAERQNMEDEI